MKYVTICFEVVNDEVFKKVNPLKIETSGLRAFQVGAFDAFEKIEELELEAINQTNLTL